MLDSVCTIPVVQVGGFLWGNDIVAIPEHCFGVEIVVPALILSKEHVEYRWTDYEAARSPLRWESNKNALWELDYRLNREASVEGIRSRSVGESRPSRPMADRVIVVPYDPD